jgi:hypothetical protein
LLFHTKFTFIFFLKDFTNFTTEGKKSFFFEEDSGKYQELCIFLYATDERYTELNSSETKNLKEIFELVMYSL